VGAGSPGPLTKDPQNGADGLFLIADSVKVVRDRKLAQLL
jgi:hypothetical protein